MKKDFIFRHETLKWAHCMPWHGGRPTQEKNILRTGQCASGSGWWAQNTLVLECIFRYDVHRKFINIDDSFHNRWCILCIDEKFICMSLFSKCQGRVEFECSPFWTATAETAWPQCVHARWCGRAANCTLLSTPRTWQGAQAPVWEVSSDEESQGSDA